MYVIHSRELVYDTRCGGSTVQRIGDIPGRVVLQWMDWWSVSVESGVISEVDVSRYELFRWIASVCPWSLLLCCYGHHDLCLTFLLAYIKHQL